MQFESEFKDFLRDHVNLNETRLNKAEDAAKSVRRFLASNLQGFVNTERQGSLALRTVIKPPRDTTEYDVDMLVLVEHKATWEAADYLDNLYDVLGSGVYKDKRCNKTRCVMLKYAGDFHMDLVPCIEKSSHKLICNRKENRFEITDGTGYRNWLLEKNSLTNGNLKRCVRLLKYLRDIRVNFTLPSILLTTLTGMTIKNPLGDRYKSISNTLLSVSSDMREYLELHPTFHEVENPVLPEEKFSRQWDEKKYNNFRKRFLEIAGRIQVAYEESDRDISLTEWKKLFGDEFGPKIKSNSSNSITASRFVNNLPKPYSV